MKPRHLPNAPPIARFARLAIVLVAPLTGFVNGCASPPPSLPPETPSSGSRCSIIDVEQGISLLAANASKRALLSQLASQGVIPVRLEVHDCQVQLEFLQDCMQAPPVPVTANQPVPRSSAAPAPPAVGDSRSKALVDKSNAAPAKPRSPYLYAHHAPDEGWTRTRGRADFFAKFHLDDFQVSSRINDATAVLAHHVYLGVYTLEQRHTYPMGAAEGPRCSKATHIVSSIHVGRFATAMGQASALDGMTNLLAHCGPYQTLPDGVQPLACGPAQAGSSSCTSTPGGQQESGCAMPLRIGLLPISPTGAQGETKEATSALSTKGALP